MNVMGNVENLSGNGLFEQAYSVGHVTGRTSEQYKRPAPTNPAYSTDIWLQQM
jgi:hypothetical protein